MKYYKFDSREDFTHKHNQVKHILGIPNETTLEYTEGIVLAENDIRANFDDDYADGLTLSESPSLPNSIMNPIVYEVIY